MSSWVFRLLLLVAPLFTVRAEEPDFKSDHKSLFEGCKKSDCAMFGIRGKNNLEVRIEKQSLVFEGGMKHDETGSYQQTFIMDGKQYPTAPNGKKSVEVRQYQGEVEPRANIPDGMSIEEASKHGKSIYGLKIDQLGFTTRPDNPVSVELGSNGEGKVVERNAEGRKVETRFPANHVPEKKNP